MAEKLQQFGLHHRLQLLHHLGRRWSFHHPSSHGRCRIIRPGIAWHRLQDEKDDFTIFHHRFLQKCEKCALFMLFFLKKCGLEYGSSFATWLLYILSVVFMSYWCPCDFNQYVWNRWIRTELDLLRVLCPGVLRWLQATPEKIAAVASL